MNLYTKTLAVLLLGASTLTAAADSDKTKAPEQNGVCSKEVLMSFFPKPLVEAVLKENDIPGDKVNKIVVQLASASDTLIKRAEAKGSKMDPNPFKEPMNREQAAKIFRETLLEDFQKVLKAQGITDDKKIQSMLDDIQQRKSKLFVDCMQKAQDDSDDDSDDDSEK